MSKVDGNYISEKETRFLNPRQAEMFTVILAEFAEFLETKGKNPEKKIGYDDIEVKIFRFRQIMRYVWSHIEVTTELPPDIADQVIEDLHDNTWKKTKKDEENYVGESKQKFADVLESWFDFKGIDWECDRDFSADEPSDQPDYLTKKELRQIWQASLTYKSIPSYNNLSPEDRDRWKAYLAQELGKPKEDVVPDDWEQINTSWKIPSLIRTNRSSGWRPDLIGRMNVDWYDSEDQCIIIPRGEATKNDDSWRQELTTEGATALENWLDQRENLEKYDGRDEIWLTRKGTPYNSDSLNDLLDNLLESAGINQTGRKLVWTSFRHSIGTYVYHETGDLELTADQLRQKSTSSTIYYIHTLKKDKQEAAEIM